MLEKVKSWSEALRVKAENAGKGFRASQLKSITHTIKFCIDILGNTSVCDAPEIKEELKQNFDAIKSNPEHLSSEKNLKELSNLFDAAASVIVSENLITITVNSSSTTSARQLLRAMHDQKYLLVVDLEMTCDVDTTGYKMEIIEVGCAVVETSSLTVIDKYESLVRPIINPTLSEFCTGLTGIEQADVDSARGFQEVHTEFNEFISKYRKDSLFVAWGSGDYKQLAQDCEFHNLHNPVTMGIMNLKSYFKSIGLSKKGFGLKKALEIANIDQGSAHRALADAMNTAKLIPFMISQSNLITEKAGGRRLVSEDRFKSVGKLLTFVLRHDPELVGVTMCENGWVEIDELLRCLSKREKSDVTKAELLEIVELERKSFEEPNNPNLKGLKGKNRFAVDRSKERVRCLQGHSYHGVKNVDYEVCTDAPDLLYHGTSVANASLILEDGVIKPMERLLVHLSDDKETATKVGGRHGSVHILTIDAKRMLRDGVTLMRALNGVYLCEEVSTKYLHNPYV